MSITPDTKVPVTWFSRLAITILTPTATMIFLTVFGLFSLFLMDLDIFDKYGIPRVSRNPHFDLCSKVDCKGLGVTYTKLAFNALLIVTFWFHHVLLANPVTKDIFRSVIPSYAILERSIYILCKLKF
jgi:hypothetical protein